MDVSHQMIGDEDALRALVRRCRRRQRVALDTEFVWTRTYYPRLGVVQVALSGDEVFLIDAVAIEDLSPLGPLLADAHVVKVLHDAPQDLTILSRHSGGEPRRIFDTRIAAGLAGLSATTSLSELLAETVGADLPKTESRTNWLQRPLTGEQLAYAVEDVCYLHAATEELLGRVRQLDRQAWLEEELGELDDPELYVERDPREQYLRIKGVGRASRRELAILRELAAWREEEARRCDRPRGRVIPDDMLLALARSKPRSAARLATYRGLGARFNQPVLDCVEAGLAVSEDESPRRVGGRRPANGNGIETLLEQALTCLRARSEALSIDAPFVASRAEVRGLVCDGPAAAPKRHRLLRGWRRGVIGDELLALLSGTDPSAGG